METISPRGRFSGPVLPRFVLGMDMSTDAKVLYTLLCDFAGGKDHCWPSQSRLAGMLSCSVSSVKKYLRELTAHDLITIRRTSFHSSTYYILRPKNAALSLRPKEPKIAYPQANSGYDKNCKKEEIKDPPLPPREAPRPSGTPRTHKRLRRGGGFFAANTDFETLWSAYPRKEAKEAARALWHQLWRRGRIPGQAVLMAALASFRASDAWNREGGRYVPQLVNWLRGQRWLDEAEGSPAKEEDARVREEAARQTARLEEAEMRRKAAHEREAEKLRPAFEKFLACFPEGTENHGPAWGLWNLLHSKGQAPSAADVSDASLSPFAFLNQWRLTHGLAR